MGKFSLRTTQQKHLEFLKEIMRNGADSDSKTYLKFCINHIEHRLRDKAEPEMRLDPELSRKFREYFNDTEAEILAVLFGTDRPLKVSQIQKITRTERGKIFRTVRQLEQMGMITAIPDTITHYVITDREKPLSPLIVECYMKIKKLESF